MTGEFTIAVHALVYLNHKKKILSSEELSENICTNPARIRKVMAKLKKANLIKTKEGLSGGYFFELNPSKVTLEMVVNALNTRIVYSSQKTGSIDLDCLISSGMAFVMDDIYIDLDNKCKERLKDITIQDIDNKIFKN